MNSTFGALVQQLLLVIKNDALKAALPILQSFLSNVAANPTQANVVAQVASLEVQLLAALPNIEMALVKDLATLVQQELATVVPSTVPPQKAM